MERLYAMPESIASGIAKESCNSRLYFLVRPNIINRMKQLSMNLRTADLIERAGGARQVAEFFSISTQAIYAWGETVPQLRVYQLRAAKPEWLKKNRTPA